MSFKKIDQDAAAGGEPFDAFTLHGVLSNQDAAYTGRPRRCARAYATGNEPILASLTPMVGLPVLWPLSPGCQALKLSLLVTVADGAARLRPVVSQGERAPWVGEEVTVTSADGLVELECDTTGFEGLVLLGVEIRSDLDDAEVDKFSLNETGDHAYLKDDRTVYLGSSANLTLDPDTRYALTFGPGAAGESYDPEYLPPSTVQWWNRAAANVDQVEVWPPYSRAREGSWLGASIEIAVHKIAQVKVHSLAVEETAYATRADLRDALRPGMAPQARAVRQLHRRNHDQHLRTKVHSVGGLPDPGLIDRQGDVVATQGAIAPFEDLFIVEVTTYDAATTYTVTISGTDHDVVAAGSAAATLAALRASIRASSDNALIVARTLGVYLVLSYRTPAQSPGLSVSAAGGGAITLTSTAARAVGASWLGDYADDEGVVDGETGDAAHRCGLRVALLLQAAGPPGLDEVIAPGVTARLTSYDSGAWGGDTQTESLGEARVLCLRDDNDQARRALRTLRYILSSLYSTTSHIPRGGPRWHTLRGMTPLWAFRAPWLTVFEGALTDDEPAATHRLLRLFAVGSQFGADGAGPVEEAGPRLLEVLAHTVWGAQEVRP